MTDFNSSSQKDRKVTATPGREDTGAGVQCNNIVTLLPRRGDKLQSGTRLGTTDTYSASLLPAARTVQTLLRSRHPSSNKQGNLENYFGKLLSIGVWERGSSRPPHNATPQRHTRGSGEATGHSCNLFWVLVLGASSSPLLQCAGDGA